MKTLEVRTQSEFIKLQNGILCVYSLYLIEDNIQ